MEIKSAHCLGNYFKRFSLGAFILLLTFLSPQQTQALENPSQYYDWNNYQGSQTVLGTQVFAQEASDTANLTTNTTDNTTTTTNTTTPSTADHHNYKEYTGYILGFTSDLAPDNPFYFVKRAQEGLAEALIFDPKKKEELHLAFAGERLSEMEYLAEQGKANYLPSLANDYNNIIEKITTNIENLQENKQNVADLLALTDQEAAKHTLVLEEVALQAPPQAEEGLQQALESSEKAVDVIADLAGRPAVPPEMVDRLQALKAQGLLSEEEVTKLISVSSRVDAREEFRKLADARVLPEADFKKLDETARFYYPSGYSNMIEIKKFRELKALESQKPDEATLQKVQQFADGYKAGDIVPPEIRSWWVPLIRLEELQATFRPDLIRADLFRHRPEDQQKYNELVERLKPRKEDVDYVNNALASNPNLLKDPAYARLKAIADKFGTADADVNRYPEARSCSSDSHWVPVPYMPNGGYCVPNLVYDPKIIDDYGFPSFCPPGYHRNSPVGDCYPDNPYGPGTEPGIGGFIPAPGSCSASYHWVPEPSSPRRGYCAPDNPSIGGGPYPGPITAPTYCPSGQMFRDGKCVTYKPAPEAGCPSGQFWNGEKCIAIKNCSPGEYQDPGSGECRGGGTTQDQCTLRAAECSNIGNSWWDSASCTCKSTIDIQPIFCSKSAGDCATGFYLDRGSCSCIKSGTYGTPPGTYSTPYSGGGGYGSREQQEATCKSGGGTCTWSGDTCNCQGYQYQTPIYSTPYSGGGGGSCQAPSSGCGSGFYWDSNMCYCRSSGSSYQTPYSGGGYATPYGGSNCGSGYYWNGSYCQSSGSYQTPYYSTPYSGSYQTPTYYTPYSGGYGTPYSGSYQTPYSGSYGTPYSGSYGTPSYGTPSYGTPEYSTPSYGTPTYETPSYGSPSYGTPEYSTPSYGTP
ncbi:hypothetical protein HY407_02500 [Candidatus Gottesmanbacteria bacterium]|nr:hypothetical protein [Candidatus Gottesmanbacteria bacterium]